MNAGAVMDVRNWFKDNVKSADGRPYLLDEDQAAAVIDDHKNTLVTARAGSGKTHTLVAKIIYQIAIKKLEPIEIMAFVFNKDAAREINDRLRGTTVNGEQLVSDDTEIARTFHSFAHRTVSTVNGRASFGKVLMDGERDSDTPEGRSLYIQSVLSRVMHADPQINEWVFRYFRDSYHKVDKQSFDSPEEYYRLIRNHESRTLDGRSVKSFSEKIIADFFFEHGIRYSYEPQYYPKNFAELGYSKPEYTQALLKKESIKADFYLPQHKIVWEHWAVTGYESLYEINDFNQSSVAGDYDEYVQSMQFKKWFYGKDWLNGRQTNEKLWYWSPFERLIETHRPKAQNREEFEEYLRQLCRSNGIKAVKYSHSELVKRAWQKQVKHLTKTLIQFIDRTQQMYYDQIDVLEQAVADMPEHEEEDILKKKFYQIGLAVYREYLKRLSLRGDNGLIYINKYNEVHKYGDYGTDFSMLLQESLRLLSNGKATPHLTRGGDVKMILVDEFQDFSRLFYENLNALRDIFPSSKLFCVGDNWQAINRFAGSEDKYYDNFTDIFSEDSTSLMLPTNYRSSASIVDIGNKVMAKLLSMPAPTFSRAHNDIVLDAKIATIDLEKYPVAPPKTGQRFDMDLQKYIEVISKLIINHRNDDRILILHRRNTLLINYNLWGVIRYRVRDYVTNELKAMTKTQFDKVVRMTDNAQDVMTVHKSKGLEADTVILLELDPKSFPSSTKNTSLFSIFGDSEEQAWKDEVRLLYVALTRAKKNLYVLWGTHDNSEKKRSDFIEALNDSGVVAYDATNLVLPTTQPTTTYGIRESKYSLV